LLDEEKYGTKQLHSPLKGIILCVTSPFVELRTFAITGKRFAFAPSFYEACKESIVHNTKTFVELGGGSVAKNGEKVFLVFHLDDSCLF
jgi:hypothetical protein